MQALALRAILERRILVMDSPWGEIVASLAQAGRPSGDEAGSEEALAEDAAVERAPVAETPEEGEPDGDARIEDEGDEDADVDETPLDEDEPDEDADDEDAPRDEEEGGEIVARAVADEVDTRALRTAPLAEAIALEDFDALVALHEASIAAGADILLTNTTAANGPALRPFGLEERASEIMRRAVQAARRAADGAERRQDGTPLVGAVLGPLPAGIAPGGALGFEEAIAAYREVILAAREGGADLFVLDAMDEMRMLKAALIALGEERQDLAVIVLLAFDAEGRLGGRATPAVAWAVARSLGADVIGASGSLPPGEMLPVQALFHHVSDLPLAFMPSTVKRSARATPAARAAAPMSALEFIRQSRELLERGAAIVGCGGMRTREHLRRLVKAARAQTPRLPEPAQRLVIAGAARDVEIGARRGIVTAAEWPARRGETIRAHRGTGLEHLLTLLDECAAADVQLLEIRSTLPQFDEAAFFHELLPALNERIDLPLIISAETPKGMRAALESSPGRPLISGVWGDAGSYETVFPLARRYGAAVVAACHTGAKLPETAQERVETAERILAAAIDAGLRQEDLIFDPVVEPARSGAAALPEALRAMRLIRERLGQPTMVRLSRVSEDLPARGQLEAAFLAMAADAGVDLAVLDAAKPRLVHLAMAASVLTARDPEARRFKARFRREEARAPRGVARRHEPSKREEREERERAGRARPERAPRAPREREERVTRERAEHAPRERTGRVRHEREERGPGARVERVLRERGERVPREREERPPARPRERFARERVDRGEESFPRWRDRAPREEARGPRREERGPRREERGPRREERFASREGGFPRREERFGRGGQRVPRFPAWQSEESRQRAFETSRGPRERPRPGGPGGRVRAGRPGERPSASRPRGEREERRPGRMEREHRGRADEHGEHRARRGGPGEGRVRRGEHGEGRGPAGERGARPHRRTQGESARRPFKKPGRPKEGDRDRRSRRKE